MRTRDGLELEGESPEAIVADLHSKAFTKEADDKAFMKALQQRTLTQTGQRIRVSSAAAFVEDLCALGLLLDKPAPQESIPAKAIVE